MMSATFPGATLVRRAMALGCALVAVVVLYALAAKPVHAVTLTVNSTADPGTGGCNSTECTLREAINVSNGLPTSETINFAIPDNPAIAGPEVKTISASSQLPPITDNVTIDGYTQAGAVANTAITNTNSAVLKIELSGRRPNGSRLAASGLTIQASSCLIKGLAIDRFGQHGVVIKSASNTLAGNFIGIDPGGTLDRGNGGDGVRIESSDNLIGGPANAAQNIISGNNDNGVLIDNIGASGTQVLGNYIGLNRNGNGFSDIGNTLDGVRVSSAPQAEIGGTLAGEGNTISDNGQHGVEIAGSSSTFTKVLGNRLGTNFNGSSAFGNTEVGVRVETPGNFVGGTATGARNVISGNLNHGVMIIGGAATGNSVLRNSIFGNGSPGGLGIALNNDGVTANDTKDPDTGPNKLQNFPVITSASTTTIEGSLNSRPNKTFTIQFFSNPAPNIPTGFGEGETFLGEKTVTTNDRGRASFTFATALTAGEFVTATTTDASGNTSEFSRARVVE